jgi:hypothetical protein
MVSIVLNITKEASSQHSFCISYFQNPIHYMKYTLHFHYCNNADLYKSQSLAFCNILDCSLTSCFLDPNTCLDLLSSYTFNLHSHLKIRDHVLHSYKIYSKVTILPILTFSILENRKDGNSSEL